jgi:hypothetical protein
MTSHPSASVLFLVPNQDGCTQLIRKKNSSNRHTDVVGAGFRLGLGEITPILAFVFNFELLRSVLHREIEFANWARRPCVSEYQRHLHFHGDFDKFPCDTSFRLYLTFNVFVNYYTSTTFIMGCGYAFTKRAA